MLFLRNSRYRNRNAPRLKKNNTNNCDANVVIAQADGIRGAGKRRFENLTMPVLLDTVLREVEKMPDHVNSDLLKEFYRHMEDNGTSQNSQKGNLEAMIHFAEHIGTSTSVFDLDHKQVLRFLDT